MTQAEVHAILGPPGDHRTRPSPSEVVSELASVGFSSREENERWDYWVGDEGVAQVGYRPDGVFTATFHETAGLMPPGPVERARWRMEKLCEAWFP